MVTAPHVWLLLPVLLPREAAEGAHEASRAIGYGWVLLDRHMLSDYKIQSRAGAGACLPAASFHAGADAIPAAVDPDQCIAQATRLARIKRQMTAAGSEDAAPGGKESNTTTTCLRL